MKTTLQLIFILLIISLTFQVQAQSSQPCPECRTAPICTMEKASFKYEFYGATPLANGNTLIKFNVANFSAFPFEYITFELPGQNVPAAAPVASYINLYHYAVQNTSSDSLIKFTGLNTGTFRYDMAETFRYEVNTALFDNGENSSITIVAKAGENISTVIFNLKDRGAKKITPLPVELISFKGNTIKQGVALTWATASEKNCDYFAVQHSPDGSNFAAIGQVKGNGTTSSQKTYAFNHLEPLGGNNYYRLKQMDMEGTFTYSPIILVESKVAPKDVVSFSIYPNPVTDQQITIRLEKTLNKGESAQVTISDLSSKTIMQQEIIDSQELKLNLMNQAFKAGIYLVKVQAGNFQTHQKIIIQ